MFNGQFVKGAKYISIPTKRKYWNWNYKPTGVLHLKGYSSYGMLRLNPISDNNEASIAFNTHASETDLSNVWVLGSGAYGSGTNLLIGNSAYGPVITFSSNSNVGIGTTNPGYKLDVAGSTNASGQSWFSYGNTSMSGYSWTNSALTTNSIEIVNNNGTVSNSSPTLVFHRYGTGGPQFRLAADGSSVLYLESAGANSARSPMPYGGGPNSYFSRLHVDGALSTTGSVSIGTINPGSYKLAVDGSAHTQSVTVDMIGWNDYVFNSNYNLPPLKEVQSYIVKNHHLPEIPSAAEVEKDGLNLGEMNKLLIKKVEELTLYLIEKDRQLNKDEDLIKKDDGAIKKLTQRIDKLENKVK